MDRGRVRDLIDPEHQSRINRNIDDANAPQNNIYSVSKTLKDGGEVLSALKIDDFKWLDDEPRRPCPRCNRRRKLFCYDCYCALSDEAKQKTPSVKLPIKLDVVRYPTELKSKSTAIHARLLGEVNSVRVLDFPTNVPVYDAATTCVLFPSADSRELRELSDDEFARLQTVIVLDCQWHKVKRMVNHDNIRVLPRVRIGNAYSTTFWRYQLVGEHCLATIEAIYYFYVEHFARQHAHLSNTEYDGRYDNLLWYYKWMHSHIVSEYEQRQKKLPEAGSKLPMHYFRTAGKDLSTITQKSSKKGKRKRRKESEAEKQQEEEKGKVEEEDNKKDE